MICCPICRDEFSDEGNYERRLDQVICEAVERLEDSNEKEAWLVKRKRAQSSINRRRLQRLREKEGSLAYTVFSAVLVIIMATFLVLRRR